MEYLDFELRIAPGAGREYPVSVLRSPAGEASGTMHFPFDTIALQSSLQSLQIALLRSGGVRRDVLSDEQQSVAQFGQQLFEALMTESVRETFRRSQDRARDSRKGLRLRLRIEAPELAALPWEYLYDPSDGDYVCLSTDTPVVRYLELDRPPAPVEVQPPLSILGMIASPTDRPALDVQRERQRVEGATAALRGAGLLKLTWLEGSTWRDLQKAMRQGPFHIFHFVGHGGFDSVSREGVMALTDDAGKTALLSATQLGRVLADHQSLRMVVLNSCLGAKGSGTDVFSSTASILVRRGVPAVIAMQYEISDDAALEFARSLYEALADELPVDAAVAEARKAISLSVNNSVEWGTPVLFMRSPDGVLFRIKGLTPSAARASGSYAALAKVAPPAEKISAERPPAAPKAPVLEAIKPPRVQPVAAPRGHSPVRRSGKLRAALWIGGILGVVAVAFVLSRPRGRIDVDMAAEQTPSPVEVPNPAAANVASPPRPTAPSLVGKDLAGAREALRASNLALGQTSYEETARSAAGTVISQSPAAGTELEAGRSVDVVLATSPRAATQREIAVPNLMGMDSGGARRTLQARNLSLGRVSSVESAAPRGTIIAQSPNPGAQLAPGASVSLTLAREATGNGRIQADVVVGFANATDPTHVFKKTDDATWGEFQNEPSPKFVFRERGRDRSYITLWDDGRNLGIRLPLTGAFIELNQDGTWVNFLPVRRVTQRVSSEIVGGQLLACAGRTTESGPEAKVVIQNLSTRAVQIYHVSDRGEEIFYQSLAPQQSSEQGTYVKHRWCIRDADSGSEIAGFLPTQAISRVAVR